MQISEVTAFLEDAYVVLNKAFFGGELPPVVITIQSSKSLGHYTMWDAWENETEGYREINLGAETLNRPIEQVIATLIHEMVHHYNATVLHQKDTSRGNTYHSKVFKRVAESTGAVKIGYDPRIGHSPTTPTDTLINFISEQGWQGVDLSRNTPDKATKGRTSHIRKYVCPVCGSSVRATKAVNIGCLDCNCPMEVEEK